MSITHNTHGKTSGKFALTKAVSCLQNSVTHTHYICTKKIVLCLQRRYPHDILTQHMNFNGIIIRRFIIVSVYRK